MHLSYRVASTERGTGRDDAVDFRKILGREHYARGRTFPLRCLRHFAPGIGPIQTHSRTLSLGHRHALDSWASVAFLLCEMASSTERSLRFFSILPL